MTRATRLFLAAICGRGRCVRLQRVLPQASHWLSFLSGRTRNWQEFDRPHDALGYASEAMFPAIACNLEIPAFVHNARVRLRLWVIIAIVVASREDPHPHYRHCARIDQSSFDRAKCSIELQWRRRGWRSFTPFHASRQTYALSTIACVIQCDEPDAIDYIESFQSWSFNFQRATVYIEVFPNMLF